jgi:hypothetical protein
VERRREGETEKRRIGEAERRGNGERGRMRLSERIKSYRDLRVFQNAMDAAMEIGGSKCHQY